ncbi:hypothetical protein ACWA5Z_06505 [Testudinibacter sp. P80/BLE/0925]
MKIEVNKPYRTRSGLKAVVLLNTASYQIQHINTPLIGYVESDMGHRYYQSWDNKGCCDNRGYDEGRNIVGTWIEPQPKVTLLELPAPVKKVNVGDEYWIIQDDRVVRVIYLAHKVQTRYLSCGRLYASESDAKAWLNAMKGARR